MVYFPGIGRALVERGAQIRCGAVKGMRIVTANISDLDPNCELQQVDAAWSPSSFTTTSATLAGIVVAPGDSQSIGCRTAVEGVVEAEKISNEVNVYTHCLVNGA